MKRVAAEKGSNRGPFQQNRGRSFAPRGQTFKRGGFVPQQTQDAGVIIRESRARRDGACATLVVRWGHKASNYPEKQRQGAGRAHQPGRVFTTSTVGADGSETLIQGKYEIAGKTLNALFDSRATHSFIAFKRASELELKIIVLDYDMNVHNATSEAVVTRLGCPQVSFRVKQ
ncbi:uncharacterized protein LOC107610862 [Arachis ipaensis]|uniref:uncharacterized protein LOC107610862 n=1 Tax=Arachis ipaensis TaxID=130454 RepID=UPI0007AF1FAD|nr:uncharacterized protein LOC107610862 [Arachis ipaensis]XP_025670134.1 uncharacterized protein LOC112769899 [Arachis hypogaea]